MKRIIYATNSPRRRELLSAFNVKFEFISSQIEERFSDCDSPEAIVMGLSFEKAMDVASRNSDAAVFASDTMVFIDDERLGKSRDAKDAFDMLKSLSGREHDVITGIALIDLQNAVKRIEYSCTRVKFRELSDEEIMRYIESGEPDDKAGAYAIQGLAGAFVEYIIGCHNNVIGLPLNLLDTIMKEELGFGLI